MNFPLKTAPATAHSHGSPYERLRAKLLLPSIPALDGIRAIAVFLVIFYHLGLERGLPALPGPLGVLGFFVLSGFLITWLLLKEEDKYGTVSLGGFYRRRALRIFPAFYVFWLVEIALRLARGGRVPWSQAWSAFFYVSNYHHAIIRPRPEFMMHTWSLGVEEQFYLLWPLCFLALARKRKVLMASLSLVIMAVWIHRIHLWTALAAKDYISYAFDTRMDALLVGCLVAIALKEDLARKLVERLCGSPWAPAVTLVLIALSAIAGSGGSLASESYRLTFGLTVEPLLVAILICQLIVHSASWGWRWLDSRPYRYLGRISYPLYLYHGLATAIAIRISGTHNALCVILTLVVSIFLANGSYRFIEKPFLALKNRSSQHPTKLKQCPLSPDECIASASPAT